MKKIYKQMRKYFCVVAVTSAFSGVASAQDSFPVMDWSNVGWSAVNDSIGKDIVTSDARKEKSNVSGNRNKITPLTFDASKTRSRINLQKFVDQTRKSNPAGASQMEKLFSSTDVIEVIGSAMASLGLSKNNAADAYAVYWISAWQAVNGDMSERTAGTYHAVSAQVASTLAQSEVFVGSNNAQKQEMAEAMMVQAALIDAAKDQMYSDSNQRRELSKAVSQGAAASGLDLDKMTLTENGFVPAKPRKKADASDAAGDDVTALASAETGGTSTESSTPNYALIAGAAGAGLGAAFLIGKAMGSKG